MGETKEKLNSYRKALSIKLSEAKNTRLMYSTFNEVDMSNCIRVQNKYKRFFRTVYKVNPGFISFMIKSVCVAIQQWPVMNSYIENDAIIYPHYCDISIAVSASKGVVAPVIRNAESLSIQQIEKKLFELSFKAIKNKLSVEDIHGGNFTITNGGIFGSLLSTPIINVPQSAILGMHKINERPIVIESQLVIKPMMYLALTCDQGVIEESQSAAFLARVKELLEDEDYLSEQLN